MRYSFSLLYCLLIAVSVSPIQAKADTITSRIQKNQEAVVREKIKGDIIEAYKFIDKSASTESNQNVRSEILQIKINGENIIVRVRTTATLGNTSSTAIAEDIWRYKNGWKIINSRLLSRTAPVSKPRGNSTRQTQSYHNTMEAFNSANEAMVNCYRRKDSEECDKLDSIVAKLTSWCGQGEAEACSALTSISSMESSEKIFHSR